jgi:predicted acyl esterase
METLDLGGVTVQRDHPVPMRDGVTLAADLYCPNGVHEPLPVLLQRTPYNKRFAQTGVYQHPAWYARQGYVVVVQDTRGRFASEVSTPLHGPLPCPTPPGWSALSVFPTPE